MTDKEKNLKQFRDNLLRISGERKMTQVDIARKMDTHRKVVNKWFTGKNCASVFSLPRLAKTLNCTIDELLEGIE